MTAPLLNPHLTGVRCFACDRPHDPHALLTVCDACGLPLRVDYDLAAVRLSLRDVERRPPTLWRYRELLPLREGDETSLAEGFTPLLRVDDRVLVKDEARNPTGSFKARGMAVAVSMAKHLGARALAAPSAGNAAGALAAYGARAKLPVTVAMPEDTPRAFVEECRLYGADVRLVPGTISDAGKQLREHGPAGAFDVSTLREPYRIEGKKTMAYEIVEQLGGRLPDVILYPTGGGTGLVGMWKAFDEMRGARLDPRGARPRLVSVQVAGCAPVVKRLRRGRRAHRAVARPAHACVRPARPRAARRLPLPARAARHPRHRRRGARGRDGARDARARRAQRHRRVPRGRRGVGGAGHAARPRLREGRRRGRRLQHGHGAQVPVTQSFSSASLSVASARAARDLIVPSGTFSRSAISAYVSPS